MKKFLSVTFAVALMAAISFGQAAGPRNGAPGGVQGGRQGQPGQGGGRMMMGGRMSKMQDEILAKLNPPLTKDQKAKIEALRKKQAAEFEKMRGQMGAPGARGGATGGAKGGAKGGTTNGTGQRTGAPPAGGANSDMREKFRTMMEKNQKDFMAILTKPQQTQYEKLMKEAIEKMRKERGGAPGAGGKAGGATGGTKTGGGKGGGR